MQRAFVEQSSSPMTGARRRERSDLFFVDPVDTARRALAAPTSTLAACDERRRAFFYSYGLAGF